MRIEGNFVFIVFPEPVPLDERYSLPTTHFTPDAVGVVCSIGDVKDDGSVEVCLRVENGSPLLISRSASRNPQQRTRRKSQYRGEPTPSFESSPEGRSMKEVQVLTAKERFARGVIEQGEGGTPFHIMQDGPIKSSIPASDRRSDAEVAELLSGDPVDRAVSRTNAAAQPPRNQSVKVRMGR